MATEIEPLIMPFDPLWVTTSKREYREAVRRMGEEPGDTKGKDGLTSCIPGKGCVIWISRKVKAPDLYALAAHEATHAAYFCKGWEDARGCKIEHDAATAYGLEVLYEE